MTIRVFAKLGDMGDAARFRIWQSDAPGQPERRAVPTWDLARAGRDACSRARSRRRAASRSRPSMPSASVVLHLMPFEANVPAGFAVLDESARAAELLAQPRVRSDPERRQRRGGQPSFAGLARSARDGRRFCISGDGADRGSSTAPSLDRAGAGRSGREREAADRDALRVDPRPGCPGRDVRGRAQGNAGGRYPGRRNGPNSGGRELRRDRQKSSDAERAATLDLAAGGWEPLTRALSAYTGRCSSPRQGTSPARPSLTKSASIRCGPGASWRCRAGSRLVALTETAATPSETVGAHGGPLHVIAGR